MIPRIRLTLVGLLAVLPTACGDVAHDAPKQADRHVTIDTPEGEVNYTQTEVPNTPQLVVPLKEDEIRTLRADAARAAELIEAYSPGTLAARQWTLQDLDEAFASWDDANDRTAYDAQTIVRILGAAFGEYCTRELDMEWVRVTDQDGVTLGVRSRHSDTISFPFAVIEKRIDAHDHGFMTRVFRLLEHKGDDVAGASAARRP